jgi:hypothetical protein
MCSLCFENNLLTIEGVRFASISKKTPLSKLSFAFVSLALPLLDMLHFLVSETKLCTLQGLECIRLLNEIICDFDLVKLSLVLYLSLQ